MALDFKKIFKIVASVAIFFIMLLVAKEAYNYIQDTLPPTQIDISINYSPHSPCRKDIPLYVKIFNDSHRQINNTSFSLSVTKDGGDNLIQLLSSAYSKDQTIAPGDTYEGCWTYPKLKTDKYAPEELTFEVKRKVITFEDFKFSGLFN